MNCIIPGLNVKVLAKGIQALAKIGDELFIEAKLDKLTLLTFNQCKTVCGQYHLLDNFFSQYSVKEDEISEENLAITCKIHMKTLLPIFKGTNLEKKLDFMRIEHESNRDVIKFKVKYKCDDIILTHTLCLMDPETITIKNCSGRGVNNICASSNFYNNLLTLFSNSDEGITLEITKSKVVVRNYCVGLPHKPKFVRSQVSLNSSEFSLYQINEETAINFSLKPFRTAIQFADALNLNIGIHFDIGGKPLSILIRSPTFEIIFIVATLNPNGDAQTTITTTSGAKTNQADHNITSEDLQALVEENWDQFNIDDIYDKSKKAKGSSVYSSKVTPIDLIISDPLNKHNNENKKRKSKEFRLVDEDLNSSENPKAKIAKVMFKRCHDSTFAMPRFNLYVPDSDSE